MNKFFLLIAICICTLSVKAQFKYLNSKTHSFAHVDTADLMLTSCDFEKDANAEVLFDKASVVCEYNSITMDRHQRIKIFNNKGNSAANIRLSYFESFENIKDIEAETINLNNNTIEYIPLDKKSIYIEKTNKYIKTVVFTFPAIKAGSIVEFKYKWQTFNTYDFPFWIFQNTIPTRYSEYSFNSKAVNNYNINIHVSQKFVIDTGFYNNNDYHEMGKSHIWALANVSSFRKEPYMSSPEDNLQYIRCQAQRYLTLFGIKDAYLKFQSLGRQLNTKLITDNKVLDTLKSIKSNEEKIAYIFNRVKTTVGWNGINTYALQDGIEKAWEKKVGNSTEVNIILYNILKQAGIKSYLVLLSTRDHGAADFSDFYLSSFNKTVLYVQSDSTKSYILDATDKNNLYNVIPVDLLNLKALLIEEQSGKVGVIDIKNSAPAAQSVYIDAEIKPEGIIKGTSTISSYNYNKIKAIKSYESDGKEKYINDLKEGNNNLKITSFEQENMIVDSLPLIQKVEFSLTLDGPDEKYIYFNPNLFTSLRNNPFESETRLSNIDMIYCNYYKISGNYKIPDGYKIEALPKVVTLVMPDNSIFFKRIIAEDNDYIKVNYIISFKKSTYSKLEYPELYEFYKKMYEMLNEQIVFKKS